MATPESNVGKVIADMNSNVKEMLTPLESAYIAGFRAGSAVSSNQGGFAPTIATTAAAAAPVKEGKKLPADAPTSASFRILPRLEALPAGEHHAPEVLFPVAISSLRQKNVAYEDRKNPGKYLIFPGIDTIRSTFNTKMIAYYGLTAKEGKTAEDQLYAMVDDVVKKGIIVMRRGNPGKSLLLAEDAAFSSKHNQIDVDDEGYLSFD